MTVTLESNVSIAALLFTMNVETTVKESLTASSTASIQEGVVEHPFSFNSTLLIVRNYVFEFSIFSSKN